MSTNKLADELRREIENAHRLLDDYKIPRYETKEVHYENFEFTLCGRIEQLNSRYADLSAESMRLLADIEKYKAMYNAFAVEAKAPLNERD